MKEMVCFDIDGTLRDTKDHIVLDSTMKALRKLKENGYKIVISTGRGKDSLEGTGMMEIIDWDGFVCNNGQVVMNSNREIIYHALMDPKAVEEVLRVAEETGRVVCLKAKQRKLNKEPNEYTFTSLKFFNNPLPPVGTYEGEDVDAMIVYGPMHDDYKDFLDIEGISVYPGESTYADVCIKGVTKASGIKVLLDLYGLKEYIAFGDSMNDYYMIREAKISVCMGQGNEDLKKMSTYVTDAIDQDGLYNACIHLGLFEEN